mmetsp:Transcript_36712/g.80356  ORF Transcript_36712/g.80356 Transcript_36712/m.80356 type:complete len:116 (-) Transcript_36712:1689-2036(-)
MRQLQLWDMLVQNDAAMRCVMDLSEETPPHTAPTRRWRFLLLFWVNDFATDTRIHVGQATAFGGGAAKSQGRTREAVQVVLQQARIFFLRYRNHAAFHSTTVDLHCIALLPPQSS